MLFPLSITTETRKADVSHAETEAQSQYRNVRPWGFESNLLRWGCTCVRFVIYHWYLIVLGYKQSESDQVLKSAGSLPAIRIMRTGLRCLFERIAGIRFYDQALIPKNAPSANTTKRMRDASS